jgi:hypothetical protein
MTVQLNIGDTVPLGQAMVNLIVMGLVTDINNPNMFAIKPQAFQKQAVLEADGLQGIQGIPGQLTFALRWQNDNLIQPSQLPTTLTNLPRDVGKFWIFGVTDQNGNTVATIMYVWWGTVIGFRSLPVGTPGPVGRYPLITPNVVLQIPGSGLGPNGADSWVAVTGPVSNPVYTYNIASPLGPTGPPSPLATWPDVDFVSHPPVPGDVLVCSSSSVPDAPTGLGILPHNTGGTLAAGIYFYVVTAYMPNGQETLPSNEVTTDTMTGNTNTVDLFWNSVPAGVQPVGYKVYRGTSIGAQNRLVATIANSAATSFTDTGAATTAGIPPFAGAPVAGRSIWRAVTPNPIFPAFYTVPESSFTALFGIDGSNQTIATFAVPPQPYPWKPLVFGQMQIFGLNFSLNPFLVGAEVLLGDPDQKKGIQVAQGFGNDEGYVTLLPQPSTPDAPSAAITSDNKFAYVPANHVGTAGTLYCNLVNQGMFGLFDFNKANSGLAVVTIPVPPQ